MSPVLLLMGAIPLGKVGAMIWGAHHAPLALRAAGAIACAGLSVGCLVLAVVGIFGKKPDEERRLSRRDLPDPDLVLARARKTAKAEQARARAADKARRTSKASAPSASSEAAADNGARPASEADPPSRDGS